MMLVRTTQQSRGLLPTSCAHRRSYSLQGFLTKVGQAHDLRFAYVNQWQEWWARSIGVMMMMMMMMILLMMMMMMIMIVLKSPVLDGAAACCIATVDSTGFWESGAKTLVLG